jgi:predicted double-glycine peptidase
MALLAPALIHAQTVVKLQGVRPDRACGPRCLLALIKTTGVGKQDCDLKVIYDIIGKPPLTITSLKDLLVAAEQLGFRVQAYRMSLGELEKQEGYAIVPVAVRLNEQAQFLHFILIKEFAQEYVHIIDPLSLETKALPVEDFAKVWNGYALIVSSRDPGTPLPKPHDGVVLTPPPNASAEPCDVIWDFGIADSGAKLEHTFLIDPKGTKPAEVKVVGKSCSCVDTKVGRDTEGNACLTIKLQVKKAGLQEAEVKLQSPGGAVIRYGVKAFGKAMFMVHPDVGYLEMPHAGETTYPVEVNYYADANDFIEFSAMRTLIPNLRTGHVTQQKQVLENGALRHKFTIPLLYKLESEPPGTVVTRKTIEFVFDAAGGPRTVSLEMTIKTGTERVKMLPQRLFLLVSAAEETPCRKVCLEFAERVPDKVVAAADTNLPLVVVSALAGNTCTAEIRVDRKAIENHPGGSVRGTIHFIPEEKGKSGDAIELPVTMLVRK